MDFWQQAAWRSRIEKIPNIRIRHIMGALHAITKKIKKMKANLVWLCPAYGGRTRTKTNSAVDTSRKTETREATEELDQGHKQYTAGARSWTEFDWTEIFRDWVTENVGCYETEDILYPSENGKSSQNTVAYYRKER